VLKRVSTPDHARGGEALLAEPMAGIPTRGQEIAEGDKVKKRRGTKKKGWTRKWGEKKESRK